MPIEAPGAPAAQERDGLAARESAPAAERVGELHRVRYAPRGRARPGPVDPLAHERRRHRRLVDAEASRRDVHHLEQDRERGHAHRDVPRTARFRAAAAAPISTAASSTQLAATTGSARPTRATRSPERVARHFGPALHRARGRSTGCPGAGPRSPSRSRHRARGSPPAPRLRTCPIARDSGSATRRARRGTRDRALAPRRARHRLGGGRAAPHRQQRPRDLARLHREQVVQHQARLEVAEQTPDRDRRREEQPPRDRSQPERCRVGGGDPERSRRVRGRRAWRRRRSRPTARCARAPRQRTARARRRATTAGAGRAGDLAPSALATTHLRAERDHRERSRAPLRPQYQRGRASEGWIRLGRTLGGPSVRVGSGDVQTRSMCYRHLNDDAATPATRCLYVRWRMIRCH